MKLGKKTVVTIGVLLSALLCVNMILYTPASADGNTKLKTSKNDISSETVNMHQGVSMSYAQIVQTYSDEYSVSLYSDKWKKFKSHAEMVKNCQLEDEKIQRMSTNELFNVVMAYPLLIDVFLYDDIDQGIKSVSQQYNGLRELLKRDDLQDVLYHKYLTYSKTEDVIDYNIYTANSIQKAITDNHISKRNIYIDFLNDKIPQIEKSMLDNYKYTDKERQKIINKQELLNDQQNAITFAAARDDETVIVKTPKGSKIKCKRKASNKKNSTKDVAQQKLAYPRATYVSTGYSKNNCHAYAWTGRQDIWMQSPVLYVSDGSYKAIKGRPKSNGQIAVWGSYTHSAIVTNYGTQDPTVTSKWGGGHIWRCGASYCPYNGPICYYGR